VLPQKFVVPMADGEEVISSLLWHPSRV